jgi:osmoprotectant transport system ATP-binding protein
LSPLSLQSISKTYQHLRALDDVSLQFNEGRITAVIGPSGCGKSTLLKLCNGLVNPDAGEVRAFGQPLEYNRLTPVRRRMGFAVQGTGLFPHLTARDNICLLAGLEGWPAGNIEQRLDELLALSQIQREQLDRYPHQLSGGQQQRVGLCRAMMLRPEILLLDEPFGAIDPITRLDIQEQFLVLHRAEPTTAVLVTHDMREALRLADHIVIMDSGRVVCSVDKVELLAGPDAVDPDTLLQSLLVGQGQ